MSTKTDEKEYVSAYVSKEVAKQIKALEGETPDGLMLEYIKSCKKDMQLNIESMDEDVLMFKGMLARVRRDFKQAKDDHLDTSYQIWQDYAKDIPELTKYVKTAVDQLRPLKEELESIQALMKDLSHWKIKDLIESISMISRAMEGQNKEMLKFLMENYNNETKS